MSKHTEGPWEVEKDTYLIWTEGGGILIACGETNRRWHRELTHEERQANAHLIAAAPDLLEALELSVEALNNPGGYCDNHARRKIDAAIAKAKGEGHE